MKLSVLDKAIAALDVDRQALLDQVKVLDAAILKLQHQRIVSKPRPAKDVVKAGAA